MIRLAKTDDIEAIMRIEKSSFIPQIQEKQTVFEKRIKECPELFLVAEENDEVYGYLCAEFMEKAPETADELALGHKPKTAADVKASMSDLIVYISSFAILPEKRGNGTGKKFWNDSIEYLTKAGNNPAFYLLVNDLWKGARKIYENNGFIYVKTFSNFFPTESSGYSDGILMKKN